MYLKSSDKHYFISVGVETGNDETVEGGAHNYPDDW